MRNLLGHTPSRHHAEVATHAQRVFRADDTAETRMNLAAFITHFEKIAPKTAARLDEGFEDALSVIVLTELDGRGISVDRRPCP
ncbi:MAG: transposase [Acidiferrobacter sp.]